MPAFQRPVDQRWLNTVSCFLKIGIHHLWPEIDGGNFTSEWCHSVEIQMRAQVVSMDPTRSYSMKSHSRKCPSSTQGLYNWRTDSAFDRQLCPARWPAHLGLYSFCREHNEMSVYTIHQEAKKIFTAETILVAIILKNINTHMLKASLHFFLLLQIPAVPAGCSGGPRQQVCGDYQPQED